MNQRTIILLAGLLILFVLVRLPGLTTPYHQDEFKTAIAAEAGLAEASAFLAHPPLTAIAFRTDALLFGGEHLRVLPLLFGIVSALLLFIVVRRWFDDRTAFWSLFLYTFSFYAVWASLMVDTDGALLPTLFLLALYFYDRARSGGNAAQWWIGALILTLIVGFLVKLSFVLVVGALAADFLFERRRELTLARLSYFGMLSLGGIALIIAVFVGVKLIDPAFNATSMVSHALYYVHWSGRSYLQVIIQSLKAVFYLSPLLIVPLLFTNRDTIKKAAPFVWYLAVGFIFYYVLFDFSHGALDKYLMFTIIPLCVLSGAALATLTSSFSWNALRASVFGILMAIVFGVLLSLPSEAVPLYPKTLWFSRVLHGDWSVLTPFNGGSGPVGFYMSFLIIAAGFLIGGLAALVVRFGRVFRREAVVILLCAGVLYNIAFIEEFSFGKAYGSVREALSAALVYINAADAIRGVNTHNDIGAYDLKRIGKYGSHFTAAPQFEAGARSTFPNYKDSFLVVAFPPLYDGFYRDFFSSCTVLFTARSGAITSTVYSSCTWTKD